jgi:hypothetical protein
MAVSLSLIATIPPETVARRDRLAPHCILLIAVTSAWCCCSPAFAQLDYMPEADDMSTASISPTSPLGVGSTTPVGGTGIRLGATEIPSAGVSPLPTFSTGTVALPGSGTTCTTLVTSPSGLIGSTDAYDGGGMAMGTATATTAATAGTAATSTSTATAGMSAPSATSTNPGMLPTLGMSTASTMGTMGTIGLSGLCGFSSGNMATSPTTPTSTAPTTPGGNPRTGIPLGSSEIANLGVSSAAAIPTPRVSLGTMGTTTPTIPTFTIPSTPSTTTTTTSNFCTTTPATIGAGGLRTISPGCQSSSLP